MMNWLLLAILSRKKRGPRDLAGLKHPPEMGAAANTIAVYAAPSATPLASLDFLLLLSISRLILTIWITITENASIINANMRYSSSGVGIPRGPIALVVDKILLEFL